MGHALDIEALYHACAPLAYRRALHLLGDDSEAWDVVHEVFESMTRNAGGFRWQAHPMTYIYRGTTNACINRWKSRAVRGDPARMQAIAALVARGGGPSEALEARDFVAVLWERFDETDRRIFVLHFVDDLPQAEIADVLGIWRRTVGRRLVKMQELARRLAEEPA